MPSTLLPATIPPFVTQRVVVELVAIKCKTPIFKKRTEL